MINLLCANMSDLQCHFCYLCLMPASIECESCHSNDDSGEKGSYFCSREHLDLHRDPGTLDYNLRG